ncbi:MAG: phenylacetate--CoA ligase family protein [Selenomonadaceae bacterium]
MAENEKYRKYWNAQIETMERDVLEELQLSLLKNEVRFAYDNAPYYKRSFDKAGVSPDDIKSLKDLARLPFINKHTERETQGVGSFLGELAAVPEEDVVFVSTSSGSTGVPTMSPFTRGDFDKFTDTVSRMFWQAGMRPSDRYLHALNFSLYIGGPDVLGAQNLGALSIWGGTLPSDRLLFVIQTYKPGFIYTSPSYAWYLGETALKKGIDPKSLSIRKIFTGGEPGASIEATRETIEKLWGAELYDFYGLSDIFGPCAAMCEQHDGLHLAEDQILVETVDPATGERIPDGEQGELVFTTLQKRARPMIRFRSGDIGRFVKEPCACGRTHGRIYIHGRKDDMFIVSAVNVFPSDVEAVLHGVGGLTSEYRIHVYDENYTSKYAVEVEKIEDESDESVAERVEKALRARIGVRPAKVTVLKAGELDTRSEHKAKRLIDDRKGH